MFKHAYSQAPNTPRSVPSFLTSRYPSQVKVDDTKQELPDASRDDNDTLFEVLKPAGFTTIGESSHFYFCDRDKYPDTCDDVTSTASRCTRTSIQGADRVGQRGRARRSRTRTTTSPGRASSKKTIAKLDELAAQQDRSSR